MSASRAGSSPSGPSRARTSRRQRSMVLVIGLAESRHAVQSRDEGPPAAALGSEHLRPFSGEAIEPAAALAALLDPPALNQAAAFEAVEDGVERRHVKVELATRSLLDQARQLI